MPLYLNKAENFDERKSCNRLYLKALESNYKFLILCIPTKFFLTKFNQQTSFCLELYG